MGRAIQDRCSGAKDAAGDCRDAPAPLRETELPVRERRGAARGGGPHVLPGQPGTFGGAPEGADRAGAGRDAALPGGASTSRSGRERGPGVIGGTPETVGLSEIFSASDARYRSLVGFLQDPEAGGLTHDQLEDRLDIDGQALLRQLLQDHLDLRASRERRAYGVRDERGECHGAVEAGHVRKLERIFGEVDVTRLAYRAKGRQNLHLQDAALNLPAERHSHGLRERCAIEATRGSFEEAQASLVRATGVEIGKRQVEGLARRAACDVVVFYEQLERGAAEESDALVISADGKGIVMGPDSLRPGTLRNARSSAHKLKTRLSKGEKRDRKRMAELAVVYDCTPVPCTATDILAREDNKPEAPTARVKWCTASVLQDAGVVIAAAFEEAERRDPQHLRPWVALVDGNNHQIAVIRAEARKRGINIAVFVDIVHVLEYLWGAAWCFFTEGNPQAETWVKDKALAVLEGNADLVAGAIARKATMLRLSTTARKKADDCTRYLKNKAPYLNYPKALSSGWPIATGVIEGACRHIVRDRFDITGARWSLDGAEAMLKLRTVRQNGDWPEYWRHHLTAEHQRIHASRYTDGIIPTAA